MTMQYNFKSTMKDTSIKTIVFSVIRDSNMFNTCVLNNPCTSGLHIVTINNTLQNKGIPTRYNEFLDTYDFTEPAWIIFCHEDFEIQEPIKPILEDLSPNALYGPIGCARKGLFPFRHQCFLGQIKEQKRDGTGSPWIVGHKTNSLTIVETFDCCCLIAHSSLIQKHDLRFDEKLAFDLYVEDFCAMAKTKHRIDSLILPFKATHHSGSRPTERLYRHLPYLEQKYRDNCFCASCTYFGTPSSIMRCERKLANLFHTLKRLFHN